MMKQADKHFESMLYAAYNYYWQNETVMLDYQYDHLTKCVYVLRDEVTDPRKDLIDWPALATSSSLYYIPKDKYGY